MGSIRFRFIVAAVLFVAVITSITTIFTIAVKSSELKKELETLSSALVKNAAASLFNPLQNLDEEGMDGAITSIFAFEDAAAVIIRDTDGTKIIRAVIKDRKDPTTAEEVEKLFPLSKKLSISSSQDEKTVIGSVSIHISEARINKAILYETLTAAVTGCINLALLIGLLLFLLERFIMRPINAINNQFSELAQSVANGDLAARGNPDTIAVDFRGIIDKSNLLIETFVTPIRKTTEKLQLIGQGDIPPLITEEYNGDFNVIKESLNNCIAAVNALVEDTSRLATAAAQGNLSVKTDPKRHKGDFRKIAQSLNQAFVTLVESITLTSEKLDKLAKGEMPGKAAGDSRFAGDLAHIATSLDKLIGTISILSEETNTLIAASREGKLTVRANTTRCEGTYRALLEGMNETVDSLVRPIKTASDYMDRIAEGTIPQKITESYRGDFEQIRQSINGLINNLNTVSAGMVQFAELSQKGEISAIAFDETQYKGIYRDIFAKLNTSARTIENPLSELLDILENVADGNMTAEMKCNCDGLFAQLKEAVNNTIERLHDILSQVNSSVAQTNIGSSQVSDAATALSQGATEAASSLEEISASLQEIGAQTKHNAENANVANNLALQSRKAAERGNEQMALLVAAMKEINEASKRVAKIIKTIDEIAFQTNVLALNAAVEAARAGEHGRGFAVVADEVRDLADRSAKAAKETAEMIEESLKRVSNGSALSEKTGGMLKEIVTGSTKVTDIVSEISAASNEQAQGLAQIASGLNQLESVTQQVTANSEESAAAAEELSAQAKHLNAMVAQFKLKGGSGTPKTFAQTAKQLAHHYEHKKPRPEAPDNDSEELYTEEDQTLEERRETHRPEADSRVQVVQPRDIIKLDDDEFGRF